MSSTGKEAASLSHSPDLFLIGRNDEGYINGMGRVLLRGEVALFCVDVLIGGYAALLLPRPDWRGQLEELAQAGLDNGDMLDMVQRADNAPGIKGQIVRS